MENLKEYYIAYIHDPNQKLENGFSSLIEKKIIVEYKNNEYREVFTEAKVSISKFFNAKKLLQEGASLIGRIDEKIDLQEMKDYFDNLGYEKTKEYIEDVSNLCFETLKKIIEGNKDYLITCLNYTKEFQANISTNVEPIKVKRK